MKNIFIYSVTILIIVALTLFLQYSAILLILGLVYIGYCIKNPKKSLWFTYFILLCIPIGNNNMLNLISINIKGKSINIFDILVCITFIIAIFIKKKNSSKYKGLNIAVFTLYLSYFIYLIYGILKGYNAVGDFKQYNMQMMLFYSVYKLVSEKDDVYKFLKISFYAVLVNSIFTICIYFFKGNSFISYLYGTYANQNRFGFNYQTLFIFTIPFGVLLTYTKKYYINKWIIYLSLGIQGILLVLGQNRTNTVLIGVFIFIVIITLLNKNKNINSLIIKIIYIIGGLGIITFFLLIVLKNNPDFLSRFLELSNISSVGNLRTRTATIDYYFSEIIEKPLGYGLGINMPLVDPGGSLYQLEGLNIDNALVTYLYKFGIINFIIYIYIYGILIKNLIQNFLISREYIYIFLLILIIFLIIAGGIFTSQLLHSIPIYSFIWFLIAFLNIKKL